MLRKREKEQRMNEKTNKNQTCKQERYIEKTETEETSKENKKEKNQHEKRHYLKSLNLVIPTNEENTIIKHNSIIHNQRRHYTPLRTSPMTAQTQRRITQTSTLRSLSRTKALIYLEVKLLN